MACEKLKTSESLRLDAEILLCSVLNYDRSKLYAYPEENLSEKEIKEFNHLIDERAKGFPVAHITGHKEFWSLSFKVSKHTLIPRPETELLVETALNLINKNKLQNIIDLGTGSGAIAIAIASEQPNLDIVATDINEKALEIAKQNSKFHQTININFKQSNWFKDIGDDLYDLIISNPPYIRDNDPHLEQGDVRFESRTALVSGKVGLEDINTIVNASSQYINNSGWLLIEHGYDQGSYG